MHLKNNNSSGKLLPGVVSIDLDFVLCLGLVLGIAPGVGLFLSLGLFYGFCQDFFILLVSICALV